MDKNIFERITKSVEKYNRKQIKVNKSKRLHPELELQRQCERWFIENDFDMTIIDSGYINQGQSKVSEVGFSDSAGNNGSLACFVEFKAPGKLRTLKHHQKAFLERKINQGCFAVCVDSVDMLERLWIVFCGHTDDRKRKGYLLDSLPLPYGNKLDSSTELFP